jgi:hypothetical protein
MRGNFERSVFLFYLITKGAFINKNKYQQPKLKHSLTKYSLEIGHGAYITNSAWGEE